MALEMPHPLLAWTVKDTTQIDHFQVFGERRTGTNFLNHLLEANLKIAPTTRYGWKHGYPAMPCISDSGLIAVITREPFSWLSSLHNRPFATSHEGLSFPDFLRTEWRDLFIPKEFGHAKWGYKGMVHASHVANQADRHPLTGKPFANPMELRTIKNQAFLGFLNRECNAFVVDYDRLRRDPVDVINAIAEIFAVGRADRVNVPDRVGAKGHPKARVQVEEISGDDRRFILENLDLNEEARLGYHPARQD